MAPWEHLGGGFTTGPAAASWAPGRLDVFGRGQDNALWHAWFADGRWSDWVSLGGGLTSRPAAVSWGPRRLDVVVKGTDNALWHRGFGTIWGSLGLWSSWRSLAEDAISGPALASGGAGRLELFALSRHNGIVHRSYHDGWRDWGVVGPLSVAPRWDPAATAGGGERIDLAYRQDLDSDHPLLIHMARRNGAWNGPHRGIGGLASTSSPAICSPAPGRLDILVRGPDNALWHSWSTDDAQHWQPWESLGGILTAAPAAVSWGGGRIDVFAKGTDDAYWHKWFDGGVWQP